MGVSEFGGIIIVPGCLNKCVFCGTLKSVPEENLKIQESRIMKNLVDLKKQGIKKIEISGNDPIEYKRIISLVRFIKNDMGFDYVQLSTHGRNLFDKEFAKKLIDAGIDKFRIPFYGSNPEIHDSITQSEGSFNETYEGLKNILSINSGLDVQCSCLIMKQNKYDLIEIMKLVQNFGITDFYFSIPFLSTGKKEFYIPTKEIGAYLKKALDYSITNKLGYYFFEMPYCVIGRYSKFLNNKCRPPNLGKYCQPPKVYNSGKKDMPVYRLKKKHEICKRCILEAECDGFIVNDIDKFGIGEIKPIRKQ